MLNKCTSLNAPFPVFSIVFVTLNFQLAPVSSCDAMESGPLQKLTDVMGCYLNNLVNICAVIAQKCSQKGQNCRSLKLWSTVSENKSLIFSTPQRLVHLWWADWQKWQIFKKNKMPSFSVSFHKWRRLSTATQRREAGQSVLTDG